MKIDDVAKILKNTAKEDKVEFSISGNTDKQGNVNITSLNISPKPIEKDSIGFVR